jgi:hypothetical protein
MSDSKNKIKIVASSSRRSKRTSSTRSETETGEKHKSSMQLKKRPAPPTYTSSVTVFKVHYHMKPSCGCEPYSDEKIFLDKKKAIEYARDTAKKTDAHWPVSVWPNECDDIRSSPCMYMSNLELFESGEMTEGTLWMVDMSHVRACGASSETMELTECEMAVGEEGYLYDMKKYKIQA